MDMRFLWMILLMVKGLSGSVSSDSMHCSEAISLREDKIVISPTVKNLQVNISRISDAKTHGIELYLALDDDCKGTIEGGFTFSDGNAKAVECDFDYRWDNGKLTIKDKTSQHATQSSAAAATSNEAIVELRKEGNEAKMFVSYPGNVTVYEKKIGQCWNIDDEKQQVQLTFKEPPTKECGIQLEAKSQLYHLNGASVDGVRCYTEVVTTSIPVPNNGTSNGSTVETSKGSTVETSSESTSKPDDSSNWWIYVLVGVIALVILVIIGVAVYVCCRKKSVEAEGDVEEGKLPEEEGEYTAAMNAWNSAKSDPEAEQTKPGSENVQKTSDKTQE